MTHDDLTLVETAQNGTQSTRPVGLYGDLSGRLTEAEMASLTGDEEQDGDADFFAFKYVLDGSKTLEEVAAKCRLVAESVDQLIEAGLELRQPVDGGIGWYHRP